MMVEFPGEGQNFPIVEETAPQACKKSLKIKKTTRQYEIFIWRA